MPSSQFDTLFNQVAAPQHEELFGVAAVLVRAGDQTASFTAIVRNYIYEAADEEGLITKIAAREFIFDKAAIVLATVTVEPRAGDQLITTENAQQRTFEILPIGKAPAVEPMPGNFRWRCRTKEVA